MCAAGYQTESRRAGIVFQCCLQLAKKATKRNLHGQLVTSPFVLLRSPGKRASLYHPMRSPRLDNFDLGYEIAR
jgi:hypothetical protein